MTMTLAEAQRQYQRAVEHVRAVREVGTIDDADERELEDACRALEVAWLEHQCGRTG